MQSGHEDAEDFRAWAELFERWDEYKVLVQQKRGTDPAYAFPGTQPEPLGLEWTCAGVNGAAVLLAR